MKLNKKVTSIFALVATSTVLLASCAAGSATAGYSVRSGSADELNSASRQRIVEEAVQRAQNQHVNTSNVAVKQANDYTDAQIEKLRAELKQTK